MTRNRRLLLAAALLLGGAAGVIGLTSLSRGGTGPLSHSLGRLGATFGSFEYRVRSRFRGPGRSSALSWFAPHRDNAAWLRKPTTTLLGAYDDGVPATLEGVISFERSIGTTLPLIQLYGAWGDKPEQQFPMTLVTAIHDLGSVPLITWEPWLTDFDGRLHPRLPLRESREQHGLAAVARGDYDFYLSTWATDAARFGHPIMVRLGHEMNDPYRYPWGPQNNTKEEYIAAWRHVVTLFRAEGANNVIWVWSPHVAYTYWELYYPGSDYVDWVATGALNFGPIAQWSQWWSFHEIFGTKYEALAAFGKPVMVAEFGSLAVGGNRADWYRRALEAIPNQYPAVKALLFFNVRSDQTTTYQRVDWTITADSSVRAAVREAIATWPNPR